MNSHQNTNGESPILRRAWLSNEIMMKRCAYNDHTCSSTILRIGLLIDPTSNFPFWWCITKRDHRICKVSHWRRRYSQRYLQNGLIFPRKKPVALEITWFVLLQVSRRLRVRQGGDVDAAFEEYLLDNLHRSSRIRGTGKNVHRKAHYQISACKLLIPNLHEFSACGENAGHKGMKKVIVHYSWSNCYMIRTDQ